MEAAKRAASAAAPLPYMNKLLSEWKRTGISAPEAIPEQAQTRPTTQRTDYRSEAAISADAAANENAGTLPADEPPFPKRSKHLHGRKKTNNLPKQKQL